jgi:hypothetical protein
VIENFCRTLKIHSLGDMLKWGSYGVQSSAMNFLLGIEISHMISYVKWKMK